MGRPAAAERLRFDLGEAAGALGDLGTFIPLTLAVLATCGLDAGSVLVFAGLFNIAGGLLFNQPIPVQPMKAIAAVAVAEALSPGEVAAAGFSAGLVILLLGASGLAARAERLVPRPVVRGIQLGVGLKLAVQGLGLIAPLPWFALDGIVLAAAAAGLVLATSGLERFPSALILFLGGCLVLAAALPPDFAWSFGWRGPSPLLPAAAEWKSGFLRGALPQIPLTLLNSVIAVCALSEDLYPKRGIKTGPMAVSVGLMNVAGCLFGAMPVCHGSGGLAGQHRFGARTGGSVVMLGAAKVALGVALGGSAAALLALFPASILGVLLIFAGIELASPARECARRDAFFTAAATAAGILALGTGAGFLLGLGAAVLNNRVTRRYPPVA